MNERIKELMVEAGWGQGQSCDDCPQCSPFDPVDFAKLIIAECVGQIEIAIPDTTCSASGAYKTAKIAAISRVNQHFGVNE